MSENFFEYKDYKIHYQYFTGNKNNAIIILVHGLGEHLGRYESWAHKFIQYNYAVCTLDLPGHGLSSGKRGHIKKYSDFYGILDTYIQKVKLDFPNAPIILYGHSMGGNIVVNYILEEKPNVKAVILSSPWLQLAVKPPVLKFWLAEFMYKFFPSYSDSTNLNPNFISRIPEEVKRYKEDKLVHGYITPGLFVPLFFKGLKAMKAGKKIYLPTLIFHGTADMLTSAEASHYFAEENEFNTFKSFENGYHELHYDICREELFENIIDWMATHVVMR